MTAGSRFLGWEPEGNLPNYSELLFTMTATTIDSRSETNIATLVPRAGKQARAFLQAVLDAGLRVRIIDGSRSFAAQDALYAKGRNGKPGPVVTNARGGFSNHNFGIAWDIGVFDADGKYLPESADYAKAGAIGRTLGLEWGGDWENIVDLPHFQCVSALPIAKMRALVLANGGDITDARALAAINVLLASDSADTPPSPAPTDDWQPIDVYLNTKKFDIAAYYKDSRVWVSPGDFADYFGGSVVTSPASPNRATLHLEGETRNLVGEVHKKHLLVKFADVNTVFGYAFRFDSAKKRLTLSK